jgi:TonB family protein
MKYLFAVFLLVLAACGQEDPRYLPASELDAKPFPLKPVDLQMPKAGRGAEYYGKLKLNVFISAAGVVDRVEVAEATVPPAFRDSAAKAFSEARWEPARKAGKRVKTVKVVEVEFEPPPEGKRAPMTPD